MAGMRDGPYRDPQLQVGRNAIGRHNQKRPQSNFDVFEDGREVVGDEVPYNDEDEGLRRIEEMRQGGAMRMAGQPMLNVPETVMPGGSSGGLSQRGMNALNHLQQRTGAQIRDTSPQSIMGLVQQVQGNPKLGSDMDMEALDILMQESGAGADVMAEEGGQPAMPMEPPPQRARRR